MKGAGMLVGNFKLSNGPAKKQADGRLRLADTEKSRKIERKMEKITFFYVVVPILLIFTSRSTLGIVLWANQKLEAKNVLTTKFARRHIGSAIG